MHWKKLSVFLGLLNLILVVAVASVIFSLGYGGTLDDIHDHIRSGYQVRSFVSEEIKDMYSTNLGMAKDVSELHFTLLLQVSLQRFWSHKKCPDTYSAYNKVIYTRTGRRLIEAMSAEDKEDISAYKDLVTYMETFNKLFPSLKIENSDHEPLFNLTVVQAQP